MKKIPTVSLEEVKMTLRRGGAGAIENHGGWCVFVDRSGKHYYVMDDEDSRPVPFHRVSPLSQARMQPISSGLVLPDR